MNTVSTCVLYSANKLSLSDVHILKRLDDSAGFHNAKDNGCSVLFQAGGAEVVL